MRSFSKRKTAATLKRNFSLKHRIDLFSFHFSFANIGSTEQLNSVNDDDSDDNNDGNDDDNNNNDGDNDKDDDDDAEKISFLRQKI